MSNTVIILHNRLSENPTPDEQDVMDQVRLVRDALGDLGYECKVRDVGTDLYRDLFPLTVDRPFFVFNLVESVLGCTGLLHIVPSILSAWKIPYTGAGEESLYLTTHKTLAKKIMRDHGISTPGWFSPCESERLDLGKKYIVKPVAEEGSAGLDEHHVFDPSTPGISAWLGSFDSTAYFVEEYIEGREFNISVTGCPRCFTIYPIPEMIFKDYPPGKARILGYRSKWEEDSFEYKHTFRKFGTLNQLPELERILKNTAIACGNTFGLSGYFRVDVRVSQDNVPYVLEVNANPCIAPDSGFVAAGRQAGLSITRIIGQIIDCLK
ncbi:MAG: ATP-grasp domain-containing protein [Bacteroidales bacterium]|jgi:D-alanine-D-alanine ligase|nr:ATP-grasp domain-containing protein [Bacteroidales bacterium]MDD2264607.1 ATP-grasp domain-containing protein [Bacteroidales bacterium]MDD2831990.1 ATP-grasp domain-containing protein [Bacteroidales bacterium]MDD3208993.1 ATP-grasp domain-containing protein [Bacteroidales bacterium]MDD3697827.1 ATP-grasp domain-containing protein [Bacteroidales bacterium]